MKMKMMSSAEGKRISLWCSYLYRAGREVVSKERRRSRSRVESRRRRALSGGEEVKMKRVNDKTA